MFPEEQTKKENALALATTNKLATKTNSLKQTIQKIVRANNDFLKKQGDQTGHRAPNSGEKSPIEIFPTEVVFEAVVAGLEYFATLTVTNLTARQKKIKIKLPKSAFFTFENSETALIAPGLQFQCKIFFKARTAEEIHDSFSVISDDFSVEVPLSVYPPRGILSFAPTVNLGFVQPETAVAFKVNFSNTGQEPLTLEFGSGEEFSLVSNSFPLTVAPLDSATAHFEAVFPRVGLFRHPVAITAQGQPQKHFIDLTGTVVSFSSFLVDEKGNEVSVLNFEEILLGDERQKKVTLINNSPRPSQFRIQILKGINNEHFREQAKPQTPFDLGLELSEQVIFVEPASGTIESYGYQVLNFRLKTTPTVEEKFLVSKFAISGDAFDQEQLNNRGKRSFNYTAFLSFEEQGGQKLLQIFANAFCPLVSFSHQSLRFGDLAVGGRRKFEIGLTNYHSGLPVVVTTPKESFLHCDPKQLSLEPKETKMVEVEFSPKNLGVFDGKYTFRLNKCFEIKMDVVASGITGERGREKMPATKVVGNAHAGRIDSLQNELAQSSDHITLQGSAPAKQPNGVFGRTSSVQTTRKAQVGNNLPQLGNRKMTVPKKTAFPSAELQEPIPVVIRSIPSLFVLKPVKNNEPNNLRTIGGKFVPDAKQTLKEFPSTPKDYEEARQVSEKLTGEKLMRLQVGPTEINFGKAFVNSSVALSFQLKNDLWSSVSCCISTDKVFEFRETPQRPQIIPSGKTGGFRIVLNSPTSKIIREKLTYIINGSHSFHFIVNAEIVPVDLEINKPALNFKFKEESIEMSTSEILTLRNTGNSAAVFRLRTDNPNSPFRVVNGEGSIRENSTKEVEILYSPVSAKDEDTLYLEIEKGGAAKAIKCVGVVNETACDILQGNVNFGSIAVGQRKSASFAIKNSHNKYYTIFKLDESTVPEGVEIRPKWGKVCPEDNQKLELEFMLRKKAEYKNHEILFQVRGSTPLRVVFSVSTVVPTVEIEQGEFNFEKITFGNKASLPLDICNKSSIPAELYLNMCSQNAFVQEKLDCVDIEYLNKGNSDSIVFERTEGTLENLNERLALTKNNDGRSKEQLSGNSTLGGREVRRKSNEPKEKMQATKDRINKAERGGDGRSFIFFLKPNRSYSFNLVFSPVKPSLYDFELLFTIPGQEVTRALTRRVYCMGTNPRFLMEPLSGSIEFARKIIISPESVVAETKTLTISNPSFEEPLIWSLNTAAIESQNTFAVTPSNGVIDPQCTVTLKVSFRPLKPQIYEAAIPLFVDNKANPHTEIRVRGEGSFPKVLLSTEEIVLPTTPLNVPTFGFIALLNDGYQNSSFTALVPTEYLKLGLTVDFLNGNMLGINNPKVFIRVSFVSSTPVAFTARVNIEDDLKRTFSFSVSGVSDNSLLTYGAFLSLGYFVNSMFRNGLDSFEAQQNYDPDFRNSQAISIDAITKAPKFSLKIDKKISEFSTPNGERRETGAGGKDASLMDESDQAGIEYFTQTSNTVKSWLLEYGISNIANFPEDLCLSHGLLFYELLEFLLKTPPPRPVVDATLKNSERVAAVVQNYYSLLNFLKENNAMVNTVRPYFLLSFKDLGIYYKANQVAHLMPDYYKISESQYKLLSLQSWTTLYLQAIKVFFVARVTAKDFKSSLLQLNEKRKKEPMAEEKTAKEAPQKDRTKKNMKPEIGKPKNGEAPSPESIFDPKNGNVSEGDSVDRENSQIAGRIMPDYPFEKNSLFSTSEALLLRWLEVVYEMKHKEPLRIASFGKELQNCHVFGSAVDTYTGNETQLCQRVKASAFLREELLSNLEHFKNGLHDFGIKEEFSDAEFLQSSQVGLLLMAVHLFKTLPSYVARSTIEFNCSLHEKMVKEIALNNPSTKTIIYTVKLFGPKNFCVETDMVKLDGKQTFMVPVSFYANTSFPAEGKIFFQNRRNGKSVAGAVVFNLKANVVSRFSMRTFNISNVNLYEIGNSEITIGNPFDKDVDFKIRIENVPPALDASLKMVKAKKGAKEEAIHSKDEGQSDFLPSFFIKQDRLWIRKGSVAKLYIQYLPVTFESHRCLLIFLDAKVGEMQYEIVGTPKPPTPIDSFKLTVPIENLNSVELNIPVKNAFFSTALAKLADKIKESKEFTYLPAVERMLLSVETTFDIEVLPSEFLSCQSPVVFGTKITQTSQKALQNEKPLNGTGALVGSGGTSKQVSPPTPLQPLLTSKLVLMPVKKVPCKDLHIKICLKGKQKFDQRFYDLFFTVLPKTIKATIEIKTTARVPVTQNIPITNNTESECLIKPTFSAVLNGHLFDIPLNQFQIKKKSFLNFPLKFVSNWIERAEGRLTLYNATTNDNFEYNLKAECEEPLSENHEEIYTKAKKRTELTLKVKNPMNDCKHFRVESDIPDAQFAKRVTFDDSRTVDFRVSFLPIIGGSFMYSVTFTDDNERYFWYLMTVHVDSPEPLRILAVATEMRKPTVCRIELENNSANMIAYKVILMGDYLTGDTGFELSANSKESYMLYYFPLKIENVRKKIGFLSEEEGEVWFDVDCRSEEPKVVKLPTFRAELGKAVSQQVSFRNPLKKKSVFVVAEQVDNSNFVVNPRKFEIKPSETFQVEVTYVPRDLNKNETEQITFVSREIGEWKYQVFGLGVPPTEFESTTVSTALGKPVTRTFSFKNPFNQELSFNVFVEAEDVSKDLFELLVPKQKNVTLAGLGTMQLVLKFSPVEIYTYKARLVIKINDNLQWVYPVVGITEAIQNYSEFSVRTKCGVEVEAASKYKLVGITNLNPEEAFEYSLKVNHKESANIEKWLKVKPVKNKLANADEEVEFAFNFLPHKPFKTVVEFVLSKPSGGRWKFKISLTATDPDFFDVLSIVSQLNVRKTIQFRLFNSDKKVSSAYAAYYTQDSDSEFMVNPPKGILEPAINDGTIIEVSYLPTQYGKAKTGVLIVETEHNLWRFLMKGMFEKYVPPKQ